MATYQDVDHFLAAHVPGQKPDQLAEETKEQLLGLIDRYEGHGHTREDLARAIAERVSPYDLTNAPEREFTEKLAELAAQVTAATQDQGAQQTAGADEMIADLATALAWDTNADIEGTKEQFFAYLMDQLWQQVRAEVEAELASSEIVWDSVEQARAAAWEPAWWAMMAAVDGLWDAGDAEGGFAALLARPQS